METLVKVLGVIALVILLAFLLALPTMWLWNYLMPIIFGLIKISFWQALAMNLLSGFLFKSTHSYSKIK
jgi:hypothetical protein